MKQHFDEIVRQFGAVFHMKEHGELIEIITPFVTTNRKFASVWLSMYEGQYVVSEGGSIYNGSYHVEPSKRDLSTQNKAFAHYLDVFEIKITKSPAGIPYYYKKCEHSANIASLVLDVASFIVGVVNSINLK